ncbi:MAG: hypothetical protein ABJP34_08440 [Erythrobacter sp.]
MRFLLIAIAVGLMAVSPAAAQRSSGSESQIGTRFKQKAQTPDADEGRAMQKRVARCVLYRNKKLVREVLANSDPVSIYFTELGMDSAKLFDELDVDHCLSRSMKNSAYRMYMRIKFRTLRALLAEEAYLMDNKKSIFLGKGAPEYLEKREGETGMHPSAVAMAKYADCMTFNALPQSDDLLRSRPGSKAESEAITALYPALEKCNLVTEGGPEIDQSVTRMLIADGLWSRAHYGASAVAEASE